MAKSVQERDYEKTKRQEIDVPKAKRGKKKKRKIKNAKG